MLPVNPKIQLRQFFQVIRDKDDVETRSPLRWLRRISGKIA